MKALDKKKNFFKDIESKIPETICEAGEDEENDISAVDIESEVVSTKKLEPVPKKAKKEKKKKHDSEEDSEGSSEEDKNKKPQLKKNKKEETDSEEDSEESPKAAKKSKKASKKKNKDSDDESDEEIEVTDDENDDDEDESGESGESGENSNEEDESEEESEESEEEDEYTQKEKAYTLQLEPIDKSMKQLQKIPLCEALTEGKVLFVNFLADDCQYLLKKLLALVDAIAENMQVLILNLPSDCTCLDTYYARRLCQAFTQKGTDLQIFFIQN